MTTKLTRFCEAIIEAGWLAALIYVPLFFNVHSSRVFEPDKISVLRSIALVMVIAWLIKLLNDGLGRGRGDDGERVSLWRRIVSTPLVLPTLLLVLAYLLSTIFSINPRISFFGSYQRLQGTYSTLSYIVIFFLVLGHLRRPEQWRRMAYTIVIVSVPIAIYGLLQRADLDPLPWGGDVQRRIAGNMGNAIFVAAYLIMAFFLTLERLLEHLGRLLRGDDSGSATMDAVLAGFYLFILAVQSLAILFTQSRGPLLGWLAGLFVFILLFLLGLRGRAGAQENSGGFVRAVERWLWAPWIALAVAGFVFLIVFNVPGSPLAPLRTNPIIGRLGTALDLESQTARVRTLIWEGASELIGPHEPLGYPATGGEGDVTVTEPDRLNALRPLIGYGPEAMWMAFNPFYPPDLAHYELRNASPDRSHNETFDLLVITGILGFVAYMSLFLSIFFFSLSWLGLMRTRGQRTLFFVLAIGGALAGSLLAYVAMGNWVLFGIALPAGMSLGILAYILTAAIWNEVAQHPMRLGQRELIIMTILATVIGHFIEIHFGIAIASTRTYFWIWSAVLVVVGMGWLKLSEQAEQPALQPVAVATTSRKKGRRGASTPVRPAASSGSQWDEVIIYSVVLGIMLFIIAFNYTINPNVLDLRSTNPIVVFIQSFTTRVDTKLGERFISLGLFRMVVFVVLVGTVVALLDIARSRATAVTGRWLGKAALISLAISLGMFFGLGLLHAATIARGRGSPAAGPLYHAGATGQHVGQPCHRVLHYQPAVDSSAGVYSLAFTPWRAGLVGRRQVVGAGRRRSAGGDWPAGHFQSQRQPGAGRHHLQAGAGLRQRTPLHRGDPALPDGHRRGAAGGLLLPVPGTGAVGAGARLDWRAADRLPGQRRRVAAAGAGAEPAEHRPLGQSGPALPGLVADDQRPAARRPRAELAGLLPGCHYSQPQRSPSAQRVRHRLSGGRPARQGAGPVRDLAGAGSAIPRHLSTPG